MAEWYLTLVTRALVRRRDEMRRSCGPICEVAVVEVSPEGHIKLLFADGKAYWFGQQEFLDTYETVEVL